LSNQKGFSLIEVIISITILTIVGVGLFSAMGTSSKSVVTTDERETAKNIAEMQMEYIKNLTYATSYQPRDITADYPGYSIVTEADGTILAQAIPGRDENIQKIEVTVQHGSKNILAITGYKVY
jgi:prepilin-type N-terminal cleavage/methylation domain-containing protein